MSSEEDNIYHYYKENIRKKMMRFDVPIENRLFVKDILDMKLQSFEEVNKKTYNDFQNSHSKTAPFFGRKYAGELTYEDWLNVAQTLYGSKTFKGGKSKASERQMSLGTVRRIFACVSSAYSYAQSQGIVIENLPLKVMQTWINPRLKEEKGLT